MFKLPAAPSPKADIHEIADYVELCSLTQGQASKREIVANLGQVDDNDNNIGCDDNEDANSDFVDEVMNEIERRKLACGTGYPFELARVGTVLRHRADACDERANIYRYLLLCTRLDMKKHRLQARIDGTCLLEELSAHALKNYMGPKRARAMVFGTATSSRFKNKVDTLCAELREGDGFRTLDKGVVRANDDKLDAVVWVPFSDMLPGQLIAFAQSKTGDNWGGMTAQLQPGAFIKKWMRQPILVDPIRVFCISEAADRSRWNGICTEAGILLDRCRLVDFSDDCPSELLDKIVRWTQEARKQLAAASF